MTFMSNVFYVRSATMKNHIWYICNSREHLLNVDEFRCKQYNHIQCIVFKQFWWIPGNRNLDCQSISCGLWIKFWYMKYFSGFFSDVKITMCSYSKLHLANNIGHGAWLILDLTVNVLMLMILYDKLVPGWPETGKKNPKNDIKNRIRPD